MGTSAFPSSVAAAEEADDDEVTTRIPDDQTLLVVHQVLYDQMRDEEPDDQRRSKLWAAAKLSAREHQVMERSADGWEPKLIAEDLGIPEDQVKTHRKRGRAKTKKYLFNPKHAAEWDIPTRLLG